jgi:hypothetical protein
MSVSLSRGAALVLLGLVAFASRASADERVLEDLASVHDACRRGDAPGRRVLNVLEVPTFRFDGYDRDGGRLLVDTSRNLRALRGAVEVLPAHLEEIAFVAAPARARELRREGHTLRLGFFLGFDGEGQPCVVRAAVGVTLVRAELAFAELLDESGRVLAREDMDRLRAWLDDEEREALPGEGPRAAVVAVAVREGHSGEALVVVRLRTDATGRVVERGLTLADLPTDAMGECVLTTLAGLTLPPGERVWRVQVRFAD